MHNPLQKRLLDVINRIISPTPKLLLLPNDAHPSFVRDGELSGTGQESMKWVSFQVHFGSFFFNTYQAEINAAKYFLRGRGDQQVLWAIGLEAPAAYLVYCLIQMLLDYFLYDRGGNAIGLGVTLRLLQISFALGLIFIAAKHIRKTKDHIKAWPVVMAWINLGLVTTAVFSIFGIRDWIYPLYGTCLPGFESCKLSLGAPSICTALSVLAIWIALFFIHRRLLEVYLGSVPKYADHSCSGLSIKSLKPHSVVVTAYESYVLPNSDASKLSAIPAPVWLFDGVPRNLSRKGQNILFSIARYATTKFLEGHDATNPVARHKEMHEKRKDDEGKEGRLWQFIGKIHSGQLRAYVVLVALILCGVSTQMSYTVHLKDFAHISQTNTLEGALTLDNTDISIDPVFKAKIKNNMPVTLASIAILWFLIALWLRNQQINSFKKWDGQFVSILPRVGYLWLLSSRREKSVPLPNWELIEFAPESNKTIDEISPETEKVIHAIEGLFLVLIIEFLHIWH